jgi:uncharacterized protein (TIGR02117 family)
VLTARPGDPALYPAENGGVDVVLVSHGFHSGLVLPREHLAEAVEAGGRPALRAVLDRFPGYDWLEVGWGEDVYYRSAPTLASPHLGLALRALFRPGNGSVVHVVGLDGSPRAMFPHADLVPIVVSREGFRRLVERLEASFATPGEGGFEELGTGLYGSSLFYRGRGAFHLLRVCNRWTADLLDAAGLPTAPLAAILPAGLIADLRWRANLRVAESESP